MRGGCGCACRLAFTLCAVASLARACNVVVPCARTDAVASLGRFLVCGGWAVGDCMHDSSLCISGTARMSDAAAWSRGHLSCGLGSTKGGVAAGVERVLYSFMWARGRTLSTCVSPLMSFARLHGSTQYNTLRVCQKTLYQHAPLAFRGAAAPTSYLCSDASFACALLGCVDSVVCHTMGCVTPLAVSSQHLCTRTSARGVLG